MQTVDEGYEKVEAVKRHDYDQNSWKREVNFVNSSTEINMLEFGLKF